MNTIRNIFSAEVTKLKPLLRRAYQSIYDYQNNRVDTYEINMREAIRGTLPIIVQFKEHIPAYKRKYIELLENDTRMKPYDLIICFDRAIYELHARVSDGTWADLPWSQELRDLLNERQEDLEETNASSEENFLTAGIGASRGTAVGKAKIVLKPEDLEHVEKGDILVTPMTDPNFIQAAERIAGIVTDRGGKVSHAAILAREFNLPCIVGCKDATKVISNGQWIKLDTLSGIVMEIK